MHSVKFLDGFYRNMFHRIQSDVIYAEKYCNIFIFPSCRSHSDRSYMSLRRHGRYIGKNSQCFNKLKLIALKINWTADFEFILLIEKFTSLFKSTGVGDAIYNHDWHDGSLEYKKMMIQIIERSQLPACIRAPTFPATNYETFMAVMTTSYKFLTVLRQSLNREE